MISLQPLRFNLVGEKLVAQLHGHSIRDKRDPGTYPNFPEPEHHFLIYIRETTQGIDARQMFDAHIGPIADSEKRLFHLAKGPKPTPAYVGRGFSNMLWRHPCYITIVLDNEGYIFNDKPGDDGEPIVFEDAKYGAQFHPNYSFYNATLIEVPILDAQGQQTAQKRHGLRFTNHIKADENGTDLGPTETRQYKFDLRVNQPIIGTTTTVLVGTDPDGQNQGPPSVP